MAGTHNAFPTPVSHALPGGAQASASVRAPRAPLNGELNCAASGVEIDIHQLRHTHATELIHAGVSIEAVRRRVGHASTETTQL
ncbi:tyrosine-type recombinase/integrase [Nonomuraea sp. JJY05]|uniref:tyrosine-type recombinase/integrase n=1 Tax=Nonomuraea sp. JJY05 TaxID=3350255 RepID=UPI00373E11A0